MRTTAVLTIATAIMVLASGETRAAVCRGDDQAGACGVQASTVRDAGRQAQSAPLIQVAERASKRRKRAATYDDDAPAPAGYRDLPGHTVPGQIFPNRPFGASPYECFTDDGGGRFRSCSAGDMR